MSVPSPLRKEKIYIKVSCSFDTTGYMQPRSITWQDGRVFQIEQIQDYRPAGSGNLPSDCDCYTILIGGDARHLFFERSDARFRSRVGRWFVERNVRE